MGQAHCHMNAYALQEMVSMTKRMLLDLWDSYLDSYPDRPEFGISRTEFVELSKNIYLTDTGWYKFPINAECLCSYIAFMMNRY